MKEENKGASKKKWSRIFRKKWFFPALYLSIAALLLSVVLWYQNLDSQVPEAGNEENASEDFNPTPIDEEAEAVLEQEENIIMPVSDQEQTEIVTKFYDYNAELEDQENALILYNNRYYQSTGIDIAKAEGETFDVVASLSGTVTEIKEDPLLGNVVVLTHDNDVTTYYASLGEVKVEVESKVKQGDVIATAGKNIFGKDNGTHVHFELRKNGKGVNPEDYFNQPVSKLDEMYEEDADVVEEQEQENTDADNSEEMDEEDKSDSEQDSEEDSDQ